MHMLSYLSQTKTTISATAAMSWTLRVTKYLEHKKIVTEKALPAFNSKLQNEDICRHLLY